MTASNDAAWTIAAPLAGWVVPLDEVPDPVFAERMLGDGLAIDPTGDTLHAPIDGTITTIHAARHALTIDGQGPDAGVGLLIHLGIDTVALNGVGIEALVAAGDSVRRGQPLLRFDLDRLVRTARAVVTPVLVTGRPACRIVPLASGAIEAGAPLFRIEAATAIAATADAATADAGAGDGVSRALRVALPHGIHARPAARIGALAREHGAVVTLVLDGRRADAASPTALLALGVAQGSAVIVEASGGRASAALDAIARLLASAEDDAPAAPPLARPGEGPGLPGVPAAPGLAIGAACWFRLPDWVLPDRADTPAVERSRLAAALDAVARALDGGGGNDTARTVIAAHAALLRDPALLAAADAAIGQGAPAAAAYRAAVRDQVAALQASGNARIAERGDDLRDVEARVLAALTGRAPPQPAIAPGSLVLADELLPSQVIAVAEAGAAGIALVGGGPTSHAAILAAGAGLPMLVAVGRALDAVRDGVTLVLDADRGRLDIAGDAGRIDAARQRLAEQQRSQAAARAHGDAPTATADGAPIEVFANLGSLADARAAVAAGAEGCGLLRTEFLFLDRDRAPDIAEQSAEYQAIADALGDRPLIVRLLDIGGDKPAPYLDLPREENPALGLRGLRVSLADRTLLDTQLAAIRAVRPRGRARVMAPMVASVAELDAVIAAADALGGGLAIGAMVETPAAAMTADLLARRAAFLSIGSNDLTQYALAMDRGNAAVAAGIDGLHPAVLRLIAATCDGAARHRCPVGVCGGLAADALAVPILLGLGVTELSMPPARVPAIKAIVRSLSLDAARRHARAVLALESPTEVRAAAARFAETHR